MAGGLLSRATDFGSGSALSGGLEARGNKKKEKKRKKNNKKKKKLSGGLEAGV